MAEESKRDLTSQSMKFDKIQIKLASPEDTGILYILCIFKAVFTDCLNG